MAHSTPNESFIKQLAANDRRARDQAVERLRTYLRQRSQIDDLDLLKLWKGLFYCMWMSDKPRNQQQLARDLAGLVDVLPQEVVVPFLDAFWITMAREWTGIDVLRMDKYLYLVRQYLNASFGYFAKAKWSNTQKLDEYMDVLAKTPLNPREQKIPNGLRYHVIDIYMDELEEFDDDESAAMPVEKLLAPLRGLRKESPTKSVRERAKGALEDTRVMEWEGQTKDVEKNVTDGMSQRDREAFEDEWGGIQD